MSSRPNPDEIVALAGWHPRYARVLAVAGNGVWAVALTDTNGDGVEVNVDHFDRDDTGRWTAGHSSGPVSGRTGTSGFGFGRDDERTRFAYGRAGRSGPVEVAVNGDVLQVVAEEAGWWAWVRPVGEQ